MLKSRGYKVKAPDLAKAIARFWDKVERGVDCWLWKAAKDKKGYGLYKLEQSSRGAHRVAWEITNLRSVPPGMVVMHTCDNPACVNPAHLRIGTNAENTADKVAKGRQTLGERNPSAKLTEDIVRKIRASRDTPRALGRQFGIHPRYATAIRNGRHWKHVK